MTLKRPEDYINVALGCFKIDGTLALAKLSLKMSAIVAFFAYSLLVIYGHGCPDALIEGLHFYTNADWALACGRWATRYMNYATANIVVPLIKVAINSVCIWMTIIVLCKLWNIKAKLSVALLPIVMIVTPATIAQTMYTYMLDAWGLSTLMGVLFVYAIIQETIVWKKMLWASVLLAVSLGLYQSAVGVISVVFLITLILKLLENTDLKQIFIWIGDFAAAVILGGIEYLLIMKLQTAHYGVDVSNRVAEFSIKKSLAALPVSIRECYVSFVKFFADGKLKHNVLYFAVFILVCACFAMLAGKKYKENGIWKSAMAVVFLLLIPIAANAVKILIPDNEISLLMEYQLIFIWPFLFALFERVRQESFSINLGRILGYCAALLVGCSYIVCANATYISYDLSYQYQISETERIIDRIYALPDYTGNDTIIFAGFIDDTFLRESVGTYKYSYGLTDNVVYWEDAHGLQNCRLKYLQNYFGLNGKIIDTERYNSIVESDAFLEMDVYPGNNSVKKIGDMIFVKLSETAPKM